MYSFPVQALDFLGRLLRYDHQERVTAKEAMVIISFETPTIFLFVESAFEDLHFPSPSPSEIVINFCAF